MSIHFIHSAQLPVLAQIKPFVQEYFEWSRQILGHSIYLLSFKCRRISTAHKKKSGVKFRDGTKQETFDKI